MNASGHRAWVLLRAGSDCVIGRYSPYRVLASSAGSVEETARSLDPSVPSILLCLDWPELGSNISVLKACLGVLGLTYVLRRCLRVIFGAIMIHYDRVYLSLSHLPSSFRPLVLVVSFHRVHGRGGYLGMSAYVILTAILGLSILLFAHSDHELRSLYDLYSMLNIVSTTSKNRVCDPKSWISSWFS